MMQNTSGKMDTGESSREGLFWHRPRRQSKGRLSRGSWVRVRLEFCHKKGTRFFHRALFLWEFFSTFYSGTSLPEKTERPYARLYRMGSS